MQLELLAPAKDKYIGIAAIDCGADAVYIAGPDFGARESAGNQYSDIEELCSYAHRFGARVYMVVNTILYDEELEAARTQIQKAYEIGCDAIIVQDLAITRMELPPIALHASTQTNIRTPEQARFLESLGFTRLILARELSVEQIREIRDAIHDNTEIETFIHGALCVSYSGQCYLSEHLCSRSANRGSCVQACRSNYDLTDKNGRVLLRNSPILSLKDLNLTSHIGELIQAGVVSFKIEGRLKNITYVRNIVRHYRTVIDNIIAQDRNLERSSYGRPEGGFTPDPEMTFNRGYTDFFINSRRGRWNSRFSAKSLGEEIGRVTRIITNGRNSCRFHIKPLKDNTVLSNGDGLLIINRNGTSSGVRIDTANGLEIQTKYIQGLQEGASVYRNYNIRFEKELERNSPVRTIPAHISVYITGDRIEVRCTAENGASAMHTLANTFGLASNQQLAKENICRQLEKRTQEYSFGITGFETETELPFIPLSVINETRRIVAEKLRADFLAGYRREEKHDPSKVIIPPAQKRRLNCSNRLSRELYEEMGIDPGIAYELDHDIDEELMRCKYCIRYELGYCPKNRQKPDNPPVPFYLINNGKRFEVNFDCRNCEMVIKRG